MYINDQPICLPIKLFVMVIRGMGDANSLMRNATNKFGATNLYLDHMRAQIAEAEDFSSESEFDEKDDEDRIKKLDISIAILAGTFLGISLILLSFSVSNFIETNETLSRLTAELDSSLLQSEAKGILTNVVHKDGKSSDAKMVVIPTELMKFSKGFLDTSYTNDLCGCLWMRAVQ